MCEQQQYGSCSDTESEEEEDEDGEEEQEQGEQLSADNKEYYDKLMVCYIKFVKKQKIIISVF